MPEPADTTLEVTEAVQARLAAFETATLRVLAIVVAFLYSTRVMVSGFILPFDDALVIIVPLSVSLAVSAGILVAYHTERLKYWTVRPLTTLLGWLVTFNVFYILHVSGNPIQFYFASLIVVAFGLGAATFRMWLLFVIPFVAIYVTLLAKVDVGYLPPYIAVLVGGSALSAVAYFVRVPAIRKLTELQVIHEVNAGQLAQSNRAKDQFLANMTHELRTPMTGVMGMIDLLQNTSMTEEQHGYLKTARKSAGYLMTVINDILDVAKLEAGKLVIKQEPFDVVGLTRDIATLFDSRVKMKGLVLDLDLPEEGPVAVLGDEVRVGQILLNLLENALKFTEQGGIRVGLSLHRKDDTVALIWRVHDTGVGISPERLPKLFDRFEQVDSSATRTKHGTGLGLAIIRELVQLMNGSAGAESELGGGSEFWFELTLPASDVELLPPSGEAAKQDNKAPEQQSLDNTRVLIAEDNPINRELIGRLVKREGWIGKTVTNGREACEVLQSDPNGFDLILMDIQMPVMDGLAALTAIREELALSLPIIALTANTLPEDVKRYQEAGFDAIVGKPIDIKALRSAVQQILIA